MYAGRPTAASPRPSRDTTRPEPPSVRSGSVTRLDTRATACRPARQIREADAVEGELASALQEPQRGRRRLRDAEEATERHPSHLLRPEAAGDDEGDGADRLRQRLDEERIAQPDRRADERRQEHLLEDAAEPAAEMPEGRAQERAALDAIEVRQPRVDPLRAALEPGDEAGARDKPAEPPPD